jgi:cation diffusion facilitator family transporter
MQLTPEQRAQRIYKLTWSGSIVNFVLLVFKFIAGFVGHSSAMIADAIHSLSDFLTDFVVIVCMRISTKPCDEDHDFGHGKYETLATSIVGILLMLVATGIFWHGAHSIWDVFHGVELQSPGMLAFWAALASIVLKEGIYQVTVRFGRDLHSEALMANAWHHRSDALSSVGTALGIGGAIWLGPSWRILDPIAAVVVSLLIVHVAAKLIKSSVSELVECSLPASVEAEIVRTAQSVEGVSDLHKLRTRQVGNCYAINMHIRMDGHLSLIEAHDKATAVERALRRKFGENTLVNVHIEPIKEKH